jgi:phage-related protein
MYCHVTGQRVVVLHAFVKKTKATQERDVAIARKRMNEVHDG